MTRRHITEGPGIPQTGAAYSAAVVAGDSCFVSGQLPLDPVTGHVVGGTVADEVRQTLRNVEAALTAAGFALDDLVSAVVVLADIESWQEMDDAWTAYFESRELPSRMVFQAGALALGARVEVQAVAVRTAH